MPAVAVKRGELVLFNVIGRKGFVDGLLTIRLIHRLLMVGIIKCYSRVEQRVIEFSG